MLRRRRKTKKKFQREKEKPEKIRRQTQKERATQRQPESRPIAVFRHLYPACYWEVDRHRHGLWRCRTTEGAPELRGRRHARNHAIESGPNDAVREMRRRDHANKHHGPYSLRQPRQSCYAGDAKQRKKFQREREKPEKIRQ